MDQLPMAMIDLIFIAILIFCAIRGYLRGAFREIVPLITWLLAIAISVYYSQQMATAYLSRFFKQETANVVAEMAITILILLVGLLCSYGLRVFLICFEVSLVNRVMGLILSFVRGVVICLLIVHSVGRTDLADNRAWKASQVVQQSMPFLSKIDRDIYERTTFNYPSVSKLEDPDILD